VGLFRFIKGPMGIITVSMFLNFAGFTIIIPVMPFLVGTYVDQAAIGLMVGIITSTYAFGQFLAAPVLGALSDRLGRRQVLLLSLLGSVVGYLVFGVGGALWVLFVGRVIDGLTGGNISTMFAYVADITEPQSRGRFYGILGAAGGLGFMMGPAIGGVVGQVSLAAPPFVAAALTFGNVLWVALALPESLPPDKRTHGFKWSQLNPFALLAQVARTPALRIAFAASFLFYLGGTMLQSNLSVFLQQVLAFGPAGIGVILFTVGVMDILSQGYLTGRLLPRIGERNLARIGLLTNALGFVLIGLVAVFPSVIFIFAGVIVFTLGDGLFQPSIGGIIANAAPRGGQGQVQGANQAQHSIARVLGPLLAAFLFTLNVSTPYFSGAAVILCGLGILLVWLR
jgi:DHA1 family tetracycline resistance protein-like MFS transporter